MAIRQGQTYRENRIILPRLNSRKWMNAAAFDIEGTARWQCSFQESVWMTKLYHRETNLVLLV